MAEKYIPLSAAVDEMKSWEQENKSYHPEDYEDEEQEEPGIPVLEVIERLNSIEPADVRPVVRGHWIAEIDGEIVPLDSDGCPGRSCHCSVCGDWLDASDEYAVKGRFCPNCGADMRPEQRKEEK